MSAMSEIYIEVVNAYEAGVKVRDISKNLGIPVKWIFDALSEDEESASADDETFTV